MKLIAPNLPIGQRFGENADGAYAADGLMGHTGWDFGSPVNYGQPVLCAVEGSVVSALLSPNNPNLAAYRAVNTIFEDETGCYEIQYGHVMQEVVKVGDVLHLGQEVATIGNTGEVFGGSPLAEITEAVKEAGSHAGAHIHFQVRLIAKESASGQLDPKKHYLNDGSGLLTLNGFRYYKPTWNNGYDGCVDPSAFFGTPAPSPELFSKDLYLGMSDPDVERLQKWLNSHGFPIATGGTPGSAGHETDYFGPMTRTAVAAYQHANHISPAVGYFGPLTRTHVNGVDN